ncbi:Uncharacterised protein [Mycobacteroides abscessus subsp. abscessus]|nr:Uncharacterised protein [Mycobacteroides abscessus subsp. abscessus]
MSGRENEGLHRGSSAGLGATGKRDVAVTLKVVHEHAVGQIAWLIDLAHGPGQPGGLPPIGVGLVFGCVHLIQQGVQRDRVVQRW